MIVEDDLVIRNELLTLLGGNGYKGVIAEDYTNIVEEIKEKNPQLLLLDIKLPKESGFSICSKVRMFSNIPIIFVTSCNTDMDELNSIMLGGDAFITKPYNTAILLAKISSLLKRTNSAEQGEVLEWENVILHLGSSRIEANNKQMDLTKNELKIMYFLFSHAGTICSRNSIIDYLWDNQLYVDDNVLSVNINRIRDKLSAIEVVDFIKTKHRQGYMI
ncbi:MAG: response regulator transcription factor [Lachnospiraceae bacterium]|nr:response regulator transcription factor [Lachnospiraceae bacterium]